MLQSPRNMFLQLQLVVVSLLLAQSTNAGLDVHAYLGAGCRGANLGNIDVDLGEPGSGCVGTINAQSLLITEFSTECDLEVWDSSSTCNAGNSRFLDPVDSGKCLEVGFSAMSGVC